MAVVCALQPIPIRGALIRGNLFSLASSSMPSLSATEVAFLMVAAQQLVLALGWVVGAAVMRLDRRSVAQWAAYAVLTGVSLVLFVASTREGAHPGLRPLGNVCVAAGLLLMQRGVRQFVGRSAPAWVYLLLLGGVAAAAWLGMSAQYAAPRVVVVSGLLGLLCVAAAWDIHLYGRHRLELRWSFWLAVPLLLTSLAFFLRAGTALVLPATAQAEGALNRALDIGTALLFLVTALVQHLTLVALVAARLATELRRLSRVDGLTELLNRRAIEELLHQEARRAVRANRPFALLMIDADHFKAINDRLGHAAGDEALRHLAQILRGQMRDVDQVGRFGGEEFIALLPGTSSTEALNAAERLREAVMRRPWAWQGETLRLTVSIGVAAWRGPHDDTAQLMKRADAALYRAKALGRDRFESDL